MEFELKPCPFCGGDADVYVYEIDLNGVAVDDAFKCYCKNCGIEHHEYRTERDAIIGWNKRINIRDELVLMLKDIALFDGGSECIKSKIARARKLLEKCK